MDKILKGYFYIDYGNLSLYVENLNLIIISNKSCKQVSDKKVRSIRRIFRDGILRVCKVYALGIIAGRPIKIKQSEIMELLEEHEYEA